jgi:hypothetical protein
LTVATHGHSTSTEKEKNKQLVGSTQQLIAALLGPTGSELSQITQKGNVFINQLALTTQ